MGNVKLKENFSQVCVWPGTVLGNNTVEDFENFIKDEFGVRVQYLENIETSADTLNGVPVSDTGGRSDLFFAVISEDVAKFAVPRLSMGIRWIEDVLAECNYTSPIYPERVFGYCSWNDENLVMDGGR